MTGDAMNTLTADDHPSVLAYRMGQVELRLTELKGQLEGISRHYPTIETINLMMNPLKDRITEIEAKNQAEETARGQYTAQLKLAIIAACISPIISAVIGLLIVTSGG